ncbi:carbohydrate sulfotransferase 5-like [Lingula anatina]|uniref:Carbohydrate sulfotransferase 5-like n=1 Tax=Lingula anatina TaxID=7574 RepID=A0A2R2MRJ8_LINAN|nr:carbohydrate sulfotransferase 5-like [Lingula anatina]|eukprot:XP_023932768.1 carbohydrate sulfotransferase 5-like [Lingula anatina]
MEVAEKLLEKDPGIRIIHLIRDPRASLSSALSLGLNDPLESAANTLCFSMFRDIKKRKELERKFPGRVFQTRYEDLAERPTETLKRVYRNLDMPLPLPVKKALTKLVHGRRNLDSFGTVRKDSSATAHAWVKAISKSTAAKIDDVCSALYPWAGYKKFDLLS